MDRSFVIALAGGSAVIGGILGALVTGLVLRPSEARVRGTVAAASAESGVEPRDPAISSRLGLVEQRLALLERQRLGLRGAPGGVASAPSGRAGAAAPDAERGSPALVDDPVFEAAVRDVIERAEQDRAGEREAQRDERRRAQIQRWTEEIAPGLSLRDDQKQKLVQIAVDYFATVRKIWEPESGAALPREQRVAAVREARTRANDAVRQALDPKQASEYDKLEDGLKIGSRRFAGGGPRERER